MKNLGIGQRVLALAWAAGWLVAVGVIGRWFWLVPADRERLALPVLLLPVTALFGLVWLFRAREAGRQKAALEAYAERELARASRPLPRRQRALSART